IIVVHHPHKNPRTTTPQPHRIHTRPLQHLPRHLQQQPLLRVHRQRLTRTHPKKPPIKHTRPIQKPTLTRIRLPHPLRIRIKQPLHTPTTITRKQRHRIHPTRHQPPQLLRRTHPTRKTTTHPHNRDRLVGCATRRDRDGGRRRRLGQLLAQHVHQY